MIKPAGEHPAGVAPSVNFSKERKMNTAEFIYVGDAQLQDVLSTLVSQNAWFQFEPRPFEEWAITVKTEHAPRMPLVFYVEHDGETWRSVFPPHLEQFSTTHTTWHEAEQWIKMNAGDSAEVKVLNQFKKAYRFVLLGKIYDIHANDYDQALVFAATENHQFQEQTFTSVEICENSELVQQEFLYAKENPFKIHYNPKMMSGFWIKKSDLGGFVAEEVRLGSVIRVSEILAFSEALTWISKNLSGFQMWANAWSV